MGGAQAVQLTFLLMLSRARSIKGFLAFPAEQPRPPGLAGGALPTLPSCIDTPRRDAAELYPQAQLFPRPLWSYTTEEGGSQGMRPGPSSSSGATTLGSLSTNTLPKPSAVGAPVVWANNTPA